MNKQDLIDKIKSKNSYLCVGLDSDIAKLPRHLLKENDPIYAFNKQIIDATIDYAVAYKPNLAFYESLGAKGWDSLARTMEYLPEEVFTIADAKRGDIGNTSRLYAKAFYEEFNFDSITVAPYMGVDSINPFLEYEGKWTVLLALTSNPSSNDFEQLVIEGSGGEKLYEKVLRTSKAWGSDEQLMYVVGATQADELLNIRKIIPDHFLLVPGVGAQGGSLEAVSKNGMNSSCGLLVNSSRGIIFASQDRDFAKEAGKKAQEIRDQMEIYLNRYCL